MLGREFLTILTDGYYKTLESTNLLIKSNTVIFERLKSRNMFGPDQLALMQEMQRKLEESKVRLANSTVEGEAGNGLIRVTLSGDRKLKKLEINADLHNFDKDDLEDLISVALSKALEKADALNETEMAQSASQFLPKF